MDVRQTQIVTEELLNYHSFHRLCASSDQQLANALHVTVDVADCDRAVLPSPGEGRPTRPSEPAPSRRRPCPGARGKLHLATPPPSPCSKLPALSSLPQTPSTSASTITPPSTPSAPVARGALVGSPCRSLLRRPSSLEPLRKEAARLSRPTQLEPINAAGACFRCSPSMALSWRADRNLLAETFSAFCGASVGLSVAGFVKLCNYAFLLDEDFTVGDAEQLFFKAVQDGQFQMTLHQFEAALHLVADFKGLSHDTVRRTVVLTGGPTLKATCAAAGVAMGPQQGSGGYAGISAGLSNSVFLEQTIDECQADKHDQGSKGYEGIPTNSSTVAITAEVVDAFKADIPTCNQGVQE